MASIITLILYIFILFSSGQIIQIIKKLLGVFTKLYLNLLSTFGFKIKKKEKLIKYDKDFYKIIGNYKVKKNKLGLKKERSISLIWTSITFITLIIIVINLEPVSGGIITKGLVKLVKNLPFFGEQINLNVFLTAILFTTLTFSLNKVIDQWNRTKPIRLLNKREKLKSKIKEELSSKELLDIVKYKEGNEE